MTEPSLVEDFDPFAGVVDEVAGSPLERLAGLLGRTRREYVPVRKILVQKPSGTPGSRASTLARLVTGRQVRALDLLLLIYALQPILGDHDPLPVATWARLLSSRTPCSSATVLKTIGTLVTMNLITSTGGRRPVLRPRYEDGSGKKWTRPASTPETGPGFFVIPHDYWTSGLSDTLAMPGKAMLLILLAETQNPATPAFKMAVERAHDFYGISERTAERGYGELGRHQLVSVKVQKIRDDKHPAGRREVYWRALLAPYGTRHRAALQQRAVAATNGQPADGNNAAAIDLSAVPA